MVLGELVPKRLALRNPERVARRFIGVISFCDRLLRPITKFLGFSTNCILKLFNANVDVSETSVTEEEIRMMIDVGREEGSIHLNEKEMIENIFELNDKEVSEIMTHRTNVTAISLDETFENIMEVFMEEKFSRLPVYEENLDNIVGILHIKDIVPFAVNPSEKDKFSVRKLMRSVYVTPESKTIDALFREMQRDRVQLAVVIDEYGGTAGIITVEDLLEEIVGNIQDEYDEEILPVQKIDENSWYVDGLCEIDELADLIPEVKLSMEDDYDTVAGLVIDALDRIPDENEHPVVVKNNMKFEVVAMDDKRIAKLKLTLISEPAEVLEESETE